MTRALIGHTGFVGSNLARQLSFDAAFNSANIEEMRGRSFDEVWCAGVQAVKWWANKEPEKDWEAIARLLDVLETVEANRFVLLSTVDVFADPCGADEGREPERDALHPYGLHRLKVEDAVRARFPHPLIVRLPGLFGQGLKKNVIFDLLHDNRLEAVHAHGRFQFYGLDRLSADVRLCSAAGLELVHFASEPVSVREIARHAFARSFDNRPQGLPPSYDIHTRHAHRWGRDGAYILSRGEVLRSIAGFVRHERAGVA